MKVTNLAIKLGLRRTFLLLSPVVFLFLFVGIVSGGSCEGISDVIVCG